MCDVKIIHVSSINDVPKNFTGLIKWKDEGMWWYKDRLPHKEDGPAVVWDDLSVQWWIDGTFYTEEEYKTEMAKRSSTLGKLILNGKFSDLEDK